jgi:septation ring formation regulator
MIPYIIGVILLIITLLIIGLILRKRVYDAVDRQELWKMDIMNRNTAAELARIKGLNLSGETQEKFESWKERWEFIVAKELPDVSDQLYEAEDAADRYRFPSAKKILQKVEQILTSIENDIEKMLLELDELLESEESSRKGIETLQPKIRSLKQNIIQNRYQYGYAEERFIEAVSELDTRLLAYDELVEIGNYLEAKDFVEQIKSELLILEEQIDEYPELLKTCTDYLPNELDELARGLKDMRNEGYRIESLGFETEIQDYQQRLLDCIKSLENGTVSEVQTIIAEINDRLQEIYELLEIEAIAKNYIETKIPSYQKTLDEIGLTFEQTKSEVEVLRKAYYFEDEDMEKYLSLEKLIAQSKNQLDELTSDLERTDKAHSKLRLQLETGFEQLEELQQKHDEFIEQIHNLRKDELDAKEKLSKMFAQVNELNRKIKKSNLPGVPNFIWSLMESAADNNDRVLKALEKQPIDIAEVQHVVSEAESTIEQTVEQVDMMLDQAYLTEQVIQYANRYRSRYPLLAAKLSEAERLFRSSEYELSLEHAAKAIEEIEPGALKQIEENQGILQA